MTKFDAGPASIASLFITVLAAQLTLFVVNWHSWVTEAADSGISTKMWHGLFERCSGTNAYKYSCRQYTVKELLLDNQLLFCVRIFMMLAAVLSWLGIFSQLGIMCSSRSFYRKVAKCSAVLTLLVSGALVLISSTWMTVATMNSYFKVTTPGLLKRVPGYAVYLCYLIGILYVLCAIITGCSGSSTEDDDETSDVDPGNMMSTFKPSNPNSPMYC